MSFSQARLDDLATRMSGYVDNGAVPGFVLLLNQGDTTWVHCHGVRDLSTRTPITADTMFRIASLTKAVLGVATMMLVEDGHLELDAPVDPWLPELANRSVVRSVTGPLDDTVPASRPITPRHLLTLTWGLGALMMEPGESPLQDAMDSLGVAPGPFQPDLSPDAFMNAIGSLPLAHQPGEGWLYHTGYDVLPILLERVTGTPLKTFLRERLFEPLGMTDTGFDMPATASSQMATAYALEGETLMMVDPAVGSRWSRPPGVPTGLVSTAHDFLAFGKLLLHEGMAPSGRLLATSSVQETVRDHIPDPIKTAYPFFPGFWDETGWGYGVSVTLHGPARGSYGWAGGFNTHWQNHPSHDLVGLLFTQRLAGGPADEDMISTFWQLARETVAG